MKKTILTPLLCLALCGAIYADDKHKHDHSHDHENKKRHHDAHVHGSGELMLVTMDNQLMIEIAVLGFDIVGFEHQPSSAEQKERVKTAIKFLQDTSANIITPEDAECSATTEGVVETSLESQEHDAHHDEHNHDEHNHHEGHEDNTHAEFKIVYNLACVDMSELSHVDIATFTQFPNMEKLTAQAATETGQFATSLSANSIRFNLR